MAKTPKPDNKKALLEAVRVGKTVTVNDPALAKAVADYAAFHKLAGEAEAAAKKVREVIEAALVEYAAAVLTTPSGTVVLTEKSRKGLNEDLIPVEILDAARITTFYAELKVAGVAGAAE